MNRRLVIVVPDARFFVTHRMALALAAKARGYDVHVATNAGAEVPQIIAAGLAWHRVRGGPLRQKPWNDLLTLLDLLALYRRLKPSLVHHVTLKPAVYGTLAARINRIPAVVNTIPGLGEVFVAHTPGDRFWRAIVLALFRTVVRHRRMKVIVQNADDLRTLLGTGAVKEEQTALIWGSGVDPDLWRLPPPPVRVPAVTCASRIVETKGIGEFAAAARLLRSRGVEARFLLAGDRDTGNSKAYSDATFGTLLAGGAVEYLGWRASMLDLYAETDIVCLPSWGGEGVPKALIEASSCELPVVTTDVPGCRDLVRHGESGFVVPPRTVEPLADALQALIEDAELRRRMGKRGREIVVERFSLQTVLDATLAVYDELLSA
ncbi:MAG TPA: glycosyltransferase family 4 protein [Thermoanaerobaculia bacterium]|nr:glycosyltransferase family 4 protein [Thermoanaerobaculia bacterium]